MAIVDPNWTISNFFRDAKSMATVDPKWTIYNFFPEREINGDCGSKLDDFQGTS